MIAMIGIVNENASPITWKFAAGGNIAFATWELFVFFSDATKLTCWLMSNSSKNIADICDAAKTYFFTQCNH